MQTFFCEWEPEACARVLDRLRLGKQRIEAIQVARILTETTDKRGWRGHPAVRMWRPWVPYLVHRYIPALLAEWRARGYESPRCEAYLRELQTVVPHAGPRPAWVTEPFIRAHRAALIRKAPDHYGRLWPGVPAELPLIWPPDAGAGAAKSARGPRP